MLSVELKKDIIKYLDEVDMSMEENTPVSEAYDLLTKVLTETV